MYLENLVTKCLLSQKPKKDGKGKRRRNKEEEEEQEPAAAVAVTTGSELLALGIETTKEVTN